MLTTNAIDLALFIEQCQGHAQTSVRIMRDLRRIDNARIEFRLASRAPRAADFSTTRRLSTLSWSHAPLHVEATWHYDENLILLTNLIQMHRAPATMHELVALHAEVTLFNLSTLALSCSLTSDSDTLLCTMPFFVVPAHCRLPATQKLFLKALDLFFKECARCASELARSYHAPGSA